MIKSSISCAFKWLTPFLYSNSAAEGRVVWQFSLFSSKRLTIASFIMRQVFFLLEMAKTAIISAKPPVFYAHIFFQLLEMECQM